ncbi:MAG: DNA/RNA nuclease SfsA [Anaerolineae bacterium]
MQYGQLVAGTFVRRDNRFRATVRIDGQQHAAHVSSSGRMWELLVKGAPVWLRPASTAGRKTAYDLALVESAGVLVSVDVRLPNHLYREAWESGAVWRAGEGSLEQEVRRGASRLDFRVTTPSASRWIEVKSVTLVEKGVALFPDAPTARGAKHLGELQSLVTSGEEGAAVFVVQRSDARRFAPHWEADPTFAAALAAASRAGVMVEAYACDVSTTSIVISHALPIELGSSTS